MAKGRMTRVAARITAATAKRQMTFASVFAKVGCSREVISRRVL